MDISHLENLSESDKIAKATVVWGVKESVFKLKNEKGISFPNHISESPFQLEDKKGKAHLHCKKAPDCCSEAFLHSEQIQVSLHFFLPDNNTLPESDIC